MDNFKTVGARMRHFRERAEISQKNFAKLIKIKPPSLSEIESGSSKNPSALTLLNASHVLGLDAMYLLTGDGAPIRAVQNLTPDEIKILMLYRDLSAAAKMDAEQAVNVLHAQEHPVKSRPNPDPVTKGVHAKRRERTA